MGKKIAFLLGAGISNPKGDLKISTKDLTEKILECKECYDEKILNRIKQLFLFLENHFGRHHSFENRKINYEDYYYWIDSIHNELRKIIENPIVEYFNDFLIKNNQNLFEPNKFNSHTEELMNLTGDALKYIEKMVGNSLNTEPYNLDHFSFLKDLNEDNDIDKAFLFTLNHDTFIENYLNQKRINYCDGFSKHDNTEKIWTPDSYENKIKMNIFKLHGSIDWRRKYSDDDCERKVYISQKIQEDKNYPLIMIGSHNKLIEYNNDINFELQYLFWKYLNECNHLIISGYSFGDNGINTRIVDWLLKSRIRKIIVIHKNEKSLRNGARRKISRNWDKLIKRKTLCIIQNKIQEVDWGGIKKSLE